MKLYLVQLNRPLHINNGTEEEKEYTPLYGFYYKQEWSRKRNPSIDDLTHYLGYLAVVHEWSNNDVDYSVENCDVWLDKKDGREHFVAGDTWSLILGEHYRQKLGLGGTLYVLDIDEQSEILLDEGFDGHFITTESLMDKLLQLVEIQREKTHRVCLFNRPIWLPKKHIWEDEGFCHLYGVITDDYDLDDEFSTIDEVTWYKDGIPYNPRSKEMREECSICLNKNNLNIRTTVMRIPAYDLAEGTRDDLIIDQGFYEMLLSAAPKDRVGCPESS